MFSFESFVKNTSIATSTMIIRRDLVKNIKFPDTKICEDYFFKCQILKKINYAICYPFFLTKYRVRKNSLQSNRFKNLLWMWKINKNLNHFNIFKNFISLLFISINSLRKYGLR
jgi:teichuronic acid biosynthesis glycosyltransferase TuaG